MENAFGQPQTIVVLGGTSDIGVAIARRLTSPVTKAIVLACRDVERGETVAASLREGAVDVDVVAFEAAEPTTHEVVVGSIVDVHGDIDVCILAAGVLGDGEATNHDVEDAAHVATVNFTGAVTAAIAVTNRMRVQGHGVLVVLSSVAGERVRRANAVYGATKAGLDGFALALGDALVGTGVRVLVVRPGFVHTSMTAGMEPAPFAATPEQVAEVTAAALRAGKRIVWAPPVLRYVFTVLRHLPAPLWRRVATR